MSYFRKLTAAETLPRTSYNTRFGGQKVPTTHTPIACTQVTVCRSVCKCTPVSEQIRRGPTILTRTGLPAARTLGRKRPPLSRRSGRSHRCIWVRRTRSQRSKGDGYGQLFGGSNIGVSSIPSSKICFHKACEAFRTNTASAGHK